MSEEEFYEVEEIRNIRKDKKKNIILLIKWDGYSESENTWEPLQNLNKKSSLKLLLSFKKKNKLKLKKLKKKVLKSAIKYWEDEINNKKSISNDSEKNSKELDFDDKNTIHAPKENKIISELIEEQICQNKENRQKENITNSLNKIHSKINGLNHLQEEFIFKKFESIKIKPIDSSNLNDDSKIINKNNDLVDMKINKNQKKDIKKNQRKNKRDSKNQSSSQKNSEKNKKTAEKFKKQLDDGFLRKYTDIYYNEVLDDIFINKIHINKKTKIIEKTEELDIASEFKCCDDTEILLKYLLAFEIQNLSLINRLVKKNK